MYNARLRPESYLHWLAEMQWGAEVAYLCMQCSAFVHLQVKRAIQLRNIMTSLGPAYIKLGQALSIRPDLLSPAAMNELQKLCDKVKLCAALPSHRPRCLCVTGQ